MQFSKHSGTNSSSYGIAIFAADFFLLVFFNFYTETLFSEKLPSTLVLQVGELKRFQKPQTFQHQLASSMMTTTLGISDKDASLSSRTISRSEATSSILSSLSRMEV